MTQTTASATLDIPANVRAVMEAHPEVLKQLTDPDFIVKLHQASVASGAQKDNDWCIACGASKGPDPVESEKV